MEQPCPTARQARQAWARLIRKVYLDDPLTCPRCGKPMRIVAVIEEPRVINRMLTHLGLPQRAPRPPPARHNLEGYQTSWDDFAIDPPFHEEAA